MNGEKKHKRRVILTYMIALFLVIGVIYSLYWLIWGRFRESTDDAYVGGNQVALMSQVPGTIIAINTDNTHLALQGRTLITLDPADTSIALQRAAANLGQTVRQVRRYYENVNEAFATVRVKEVNLEKAQLDLQRRKGLVEQRAISKEELQHNITIVKAAEAELNSSLSTLASAMSLVQNSHLYQHPLVESAKANFKIAYLNLVRTQIKAPVTGYVANRTAQVGQQITSGTFLLAVIPLNEIWVDANFKETQLRRIRIGQEVSLTVDAYGSLKYHGKIVGLAPGTGSVFNLLPPQNATGNWIKIVQRVPVRISLSPNEIAKHPLQLGLSMRVTVNTRNMKGGLLARVSDHRPLYSTDIFNKQLANAEKKMNAIILASAPDISAPNISTQGILQREEHHAD